MKTPIWRWYQKGGRSADRDSAGSAERLPRKNHYERLNSYRNSAEYAEFAKAIGADVPSGDLPSILGNKWEINEEIYHEFLGMLPPMGWRNGAFYMCEFSFDDITTKFTKAGDRYSCEFARFPERKQTPVSTPWGLSQTTRELAPGITLYTTASHGGFYLSPERVALMPKPLRDFIPFGGPQQGPGRWYEEDCDWSVVALAFPQFFKRDDVAAAEATLKNYKPEIHAELIALRAGGRGA